MSLMSVVASSSDATGAPDERTARLLAHRAHRVVDVDEHRGREEEARTGHALSTEEHLFLRARGLAEGRGIEGGVPAAERRR